MEGQQSKILLYSLPCIVRVRCDNTICTFGPFFWDFSTVDFGKLHRTSLPDGKSMAQSSADTINGSVDLKYRETVLSLIYEKSMQCK